LDPRVSFLYSVLILLLFSGCHPEKDQQVSEVDPVSDKRQSQNPEIQQYKMDSEALIKASFEKDKSCRKVFTGNKGNFSYPAISYARVFAHSFLQDLCGDESALVSLLTSPSMGEKDALSLPLFNKGATRDKSQSNLITTYALIYALGRRESSGNFYQGRDLTASNTEALTEEAGFVQVSANSLYLKGSTKDAKNFLMEFFQYYLLLLSQKEKTELAQTCLSNTLGPESETRNFDSSGLKLHLLFHYGECQGLAQRIKEKKWVIDEKAAGCFRRLTKECPGFAIKYGAAIARIRRDHNGPLILHEEFSKNVDPKYLKPYLEPACHELFRVFASKKKQLCLPQ
jgi:hypothetical protein